MLAASHALTGAVIAAKTQNPVLGFALAFLSHPILDLIPHWDFNSRNNGRPVKQTIIVSLLDSATGFIAGFLLFRTSVALETLLLTMFIAQLPDWFEAPYHVFKWKFPPFSTVKKLQHIIHIKLDLPWGLLTQIAFVVAVILI